MSAVISQGSASLQMGDINPDFMCRQMLLTAARDMFASLSLHIQGLPVLLQKNDMSPWGMGSKESTPYESVTLTLEMVRQKLTLNGFGVKFDPKYAYPRWSLVSLEFSESVGSKMTPEPISNVKVNREILTWQFIFRHL